MTGSTDRVDGADRVPVTVLSGFLGSGKTTLLNRLLRHPTLADTAVIVNEFGEIGLDHVLIEAAEDNVVLLDAGCLCCRIGTTLKDTLEDLWVRRVGGRIPRFRRAIIETTGLADPAPILHTLTNDRGITGFYRLDGVVVTVDAYHGDASLDVHREAVKQAAVADRLVLTKTDIATPAEVARLRDRLRAINPGAPIVTATGGDVDPAAILDAGPFDPAGKSADVQGWLNAEAYHHHHHDHGALDPNRHDDRVHAWCFWIDRPVSWAGLDAWSSLLRERHGDALLRMKGILRIAEGDQAVVIHAVHHIFDRPVPLGTWPSDDPRGRIIVIGRDLDEAAVAATLPALSAPAGSRAF